jgi:hypothetical protein
MCGALIPLLYAPPWHKNRSIRIETTLPFIIISYYDESMMVYSGKQFLSLKTIRFVLN